MIFAATTLFSKIPVCILNKVISRKFKKKIGQLSSFLKKLGIMRLKSAIFSPIYWFLLIMIPKILRSFWGWKLWKKKFQPETGFWRTSRLLWLVEIWNLLYKCYLFPQNFMPWRLKLWNWHHGGWPLMDLKSFVNMVRRVKPIFKWVSLLKSWSWNSKS